MKKYVVTLSEAERRDLEKVVSRGNHRSQKVLNALILLGCDEGKYQDQRAKNDDLSRILRVSMRKIDRVKKRFVSEGIDVALNGQRGVRVYKRLADGDFEAHLIALSCSDPPEGFSRWSLRLLADKVVELNYIDSVSHETIRRVLKKTNSSRGVTSDG